MSEELKIEIKADTIAIKNAEKELTHFGNVVRKVEGYVSSWTVQASKFSLIAVGVEKSFSLLKSSISGLVSNYTEYATVLQNTSVQMDVSVQKLSALKYAAEQNGTSFETMTDAMKTFNEQLGAARFGDQGAIDKLGAVGIDYTQFEGLSSDEAFKKLADHIARIGDKSKQTRAAIELFGDAGYQLLPMFQQGSAGIDRLCNEAETLGITMGDTSGAMELMGAITKLKSAFQTIGIKIAEMLSGPITEIIEFAGALISRVSEWIAKSEQCATLIPSLVIGFGTFAIAITTLSGVLGLLTSAWTVFTAAAAANPITMWSVLLGTAIVGMIAFVECLENMTQKQYEYSEAAQNHEKDVNKAADADQKLFDRLQELSNLEDPLNNSEVEEARKLVEELESRYGDLGIEIDKTSGKIHGMTEAQKKFAEEIKKQKIEAAEQTIRELRGNIASRKMELDDAVTKDKKDQEVWTFWYNKMGGKDKDQERIRAAEEDLADEERKLREEEIRLRELKGFESSTPEEGEKSLTQLTSENRANRQKLNDEKGAALKELEGFKPDSDLDFRSEQDKAYSNVLNQYEEKIQALAKEQALMETAGLDPSTIENRRELIEQWKEQELAKVAEKYKSQEPAKEPELINIGEDARLTKAKNRLRAVTDARDEAVLKGGDLELADKAVADAKLELARTVAEVSGVARAKARSGYESALKDYEAGKAQGLGNVELNKLAEAVQKAERAYNDENSKYQSAVGEIRAAMGGDVQNPEESVQDAIQTTLSSSGTFSAYGMDATVSKDIPQQTLDVLRKMLDNTDKIKEEQKNAGAFAQ